MPSHNTGLGLADILRVTSSTAPNMLQRLGATLQGQPDPQQAFEQQDFARRVGIANLLQQQKRFGIEEEELGIKKEGAEIQKVKLFFDFVKEIKDGEAKTNFVRQFGPQIPAVKKYLGDAVNKVVFTGEGQKFSEPVTVKRDPATGELTPKIINRITGQPHPEGEYQIEGEFIGVNPRIDRIIPSKEAEVERRFQQSQERLERQGAAAEERFQQLQAGIEQRHTETLTALQSNRAFQQADTMRKEYLAQSKTFIETRDSYNRIVASAKEPSPAGDLSLIYGYMKMVDPLSRAVLPSEFALAQKARPLLERAGLSWDRLKNVWEGKEMTTGQRKDFLDRASKIFNQQSESQNKVISEFRRVAASQGVDPEKVIVDLGPSPTIKPSGKAKPKILSIEEVK